MYHLIPSLLTLLPLALAASASLEKRDYVGQETTITFFGYPDNCDDTGCYNDNTAYECSNPDGTDRGNIAGGDGSFNNPLSAAIQPGGNFQQCQIGYTTYLQKFLIFDGRLSWRSTFSQVLTHLRRALRQLRHKPYRHMGR